MAKDVEIKAIQVTFNVRDPEQRRAYEHAYGKTNSSGYIKRLIDRDLTGMAPVAPSAKVINTGNKLMDEDLEFEVGSFV